VTFRPILAGSIFRAFYATLYEKQQPKPVDCSVIRCVVNLRV
jgi:hypothetical protein